MYRPIAACLVVLVASCGDGTSEAPPVLHELALTTAEDTPVGVELEVSAIDAKAVVLTIAVAPSHGTLTGTGPSWTYTPNADYTGDDAFIVHGADRLGSSDAGVAITITAVDDAPIANPDSFAAGFETNLTVALATLLANDTDIDSTALGVTGVMMATHGTPVIAGDDVVFAPEPGFQGTATFSYQISDGTLTATGAVSIAVGADQAPIASADAVTTDEDTALAIDDATLLANDLDPESQTLAISAVGAASHGTVTHAGTQVSFVPDPDFHGDAGFDYTISDGYLTATASVVITVGAVNDAPVAVADLAITDEDAPLALTSATLTANDSDVDGDALAVSGVTGGAETHGTVTLADGVVRYVPVADFHGSAVFSYAVSDGNGGTATATVTVTVSSINDAPLAVADAQVTSEDTPLVFAAALLTANDSDADADPLTVTAVAATETTHGAVALADGTITYTPAADYHGPADITYTIDDGHGGTATAAVAITVTPVNDLPIANADVAATAEDTALVLAAGALTANDRDLDGDALTVTAVAGTATTHGTVALEGTTITYTPALDYHGAADFTYTITDGTVTASASVAVTVTAVNDAPVAVDDDLVAIEDTALAFAAPALTANDHDVDDDALTVSSVAASATTHGTVALAGGTITYTPAGNYHGAAAFTYTISDGHGGTASAQVAIAIAPVNDAPVANDDSATTPEDTALALAAATLTGNDSDLDGDPLTVTSVAATATTHGTVTLTGVTVSYTPAANYNGAADFAYTIEDGHGGTASAQVALTITPVNDAPVANNDSATTAEDAALELAASSLTGNDSDVDGDTLTVTSVTATPTTHGTVALASGSISYTPTANYNGPADFSYTISDGHGRTASATVAVTVSPVNDAPVVTASSTTLTYVENAAAVKADAAIVVSDGDSATLIGASVRIATGCASPEDVLALAAPPSGITVTGYAAATCTLTLTGAASPATYQAALRGVTYANTSEAPATAARVLRFTVDDGAAAGNTGSADRDLTLTAVDDAPVAVNDAATVAEDAPATSIPVLGNDTDVDAGPRSIASITQPASGTVVITGGGTGLTYAPHGNTCNSPPGSAPDSFTYTLTPGGSTATVSVTVTCVDDAPVAVDDDAAVAEDSVSTTLDVLANDTDVDGGPKLVATITQPAHGTAAISVLGLFVTYKPAPNYCNQAPNTPPDTFTYTLGPGGSTATVAVTVACACGKHKPTDFVVGSN